VTKVKLEIELDIPDVSEFSDAEISQLVFDTYTNYVVVQHLQDAMYWLARPTSQDQPSKAADKLISQHHRIWAKIARAATHTAKITIEK